MDADDLRLFETSLRQAVHRRVTLDAALAEIGWHDAIADDPTVAAAVFAVQGELNLTSSAIDDVVAAALGMTPTSTQAVVLPALGTATPPASGGSVNGFGTTRILAAETAVVVSSRDGNAVASVVPAKVLGRRTVSGLDPGGGWVEISGAAELDTTAEVDWEHGVAAARRAIAQELTAASRAMLRLAREHATVREQFGVTISSFQAVRHRLADCLVSVESADAAVAVAWADPSPFAATMAKAIAGRSAATVATHAQQVLAGIGFTSEHPFHRYLKRTMLLDQLFGTTASLSAEIGAEVLRSGSVPAMLPL